jgi:hypothetical protein
VCVWRYNNPTHTSKDKKMLPLFSFEKSALQNSKSKHESNLITLSRNLVIEDFVVTPIQHEATRPTCQVIKGTNVGVKITPKQALVEYLIKACNIEIDADGVYIDCYNPFPDITNAKNTEIFACEWAVIPVKPQYKGIRTEAKKDERYLDVLNNAMTQWDETKDVRTSKAIAKIQKLIQNVLDKHNSDILNDYHELIVGQNVNDEWFKENLPEKDSEIVTRKNTESEALKEKRKQLVAEISKLDKTVDENRKEVYDVQRTFIVTSLLEDAGDASKAYIESLKDIEKPKTHKGPRFV